METGGIGTDARSGVLFGREIHQRGVSRSNTAQAGTMSDRTHATHTVERPYGLRIKWMIPEVCVCEKRGEYLSVGV